MYYGLYFTHLIGLSVWFGSLVLIVLLMRAARSEEDQSNWAILLMKGKVWTTLQLTAVAVLVSGVGLMINAGLIGKSKPLWLKLMEEAGGMVALLFVVLVTWLTRNMRKALKEENNTRIAQIMKRFTITILSSIAMITGVILIVSLRLT